MTKWTNWTLVRHYITPRVEYLLDETVPDPQAQRAQSREAVSWADADTKVRLRPHKLFIPLTSSAFCRLAVWIGKWIHCRYEALLILGPLRMKKWFSSFSQHEHEFLWMASQREPDERCPLWSPPRFYITYLHKHYKDATQSGIKYSAPTVCHWNGDQASC